MTVDKPHRCDHLAAVWPETGGHPDVSWSTQLSMLFHITWTAVQAFREVSMVGKFREGLRHHARASFYMRPALAEGENASQSPAT